ncbi:hypothetical protein [Neisseria sp. CCUG12390]|uniref:hypothetical protein n=1 Tax=Neisseria sp. CCUG12390 TaxID=3392035 RepID=UPI003A10395A
MDKIKVMHDKDPSKPMPTLTHTGHSLGGTLAQISAHYFNHQGVTFNAYGAASLPRIPEGGGRVVNYVKASDPVAAASGHYGSVVVLATPDEINRLSKAGYTNSRAANVLLPSTVYGAAATSVGSAHSIDNFTGSRSILSDPNARKLAQNNAILIDAYRSDVNQERIGLNILLNASDPVRNINNTIDMLKRDRPAGEPARKNLPPLAQAQPFDLEIQQYAQTPALSFADMPKQVRDMCGQCRTLLTEFDREEGVTRSRSDYDAISLSMATKAYAAGLPEVKFIHVQGDGQINIGYESPQGMFKDTSIQTNQALALSLEDNVLQAKQTERDFALAEEQRAREAEYRAQSYGGRSYG